MKVSTPVRRALLSASAALAAILAASPAGAQALRGKITDPNETRSCASACPEVINIGQAEQTQTGAVNAAIVINGTSVTVSPTPPDGSGYPAVVTADSITSLATAIGNNLSYKVQNELRLVGSATQTLSAPVAATNAITTTAAVPGLITSVTSAFGNTAQAEVCCGGMDVTFNQAVLAATGEISAIGTVQTAPGLGTLAMSSTASANVIGASAVNGPMTLGANQSNAANLFSRSQGQVCCNTQSITLGSTAAANSSTTTSETSTVYTTAHQTNSGHVTSQSSHVTNSGRLITSATQATGNSVTALNRWGYTQVDGSQHNSGSINAHGGLQAHNYLQSAAVGANATANSLLLSSVGSDATTSFTQVNDLTGGVFAQADFVASSASGGVGQAVAQATGNAMTAYACTSCGQNNVKVEGYFTQTNNGSIHSVANVGGGTGGAIVAQATAVGNSASFIAQQGAGH